MIRNILFDRDGFLSRKETLDQQIEDLILENENLTRSIKDSGLKIESLRENLEANKEQTVFLEKKVLELSSEKNSRLEICKSIQLRKEEIEKRIQNAKDSIQNVISKKQEFEKEVSELEQQIESSYNEFLDMSRALESEKESLRNILKEIQNLKHDIQKNQDDFKNLIPVLTEKERTVSGLKVQIDSFTEELYNDYSISEQELVSEFQNRNLERTKEEVKLKKLKSDIQMLGSINPLSIEEYRSVKEIYEHHRVQKEDIEKSKADVEEVLGRINEESENYSARRLKRFERIFRKHFPHFSTEGERS